MTRGNGGEMKIVVLGSGGQLGRDICNVLPNAVALTRKDGDITDFDRLRWILAGADVVINCAALTSVDLLETAVHCAFVINAIAVRNIAQICRDINATLIHISTDYVLSGMSETPYNEQDLPEPQNVYGISKLAGEFFIRSLCPKHFILRTSGLYGHSSKHNFVETVIAKIKDAAATRSIQMNGYLSVVNDQYCTPTSTADIANAIKESI